MQDYLLFLDTETTGLPRKWTAAYAVAGNWPSAVQVAWMLYTKDGKEVKRENFYISDNDVPITARAHEIHGLNSTFLVQHGKPRKQVMQLLAHDMLQYQPLVVGHFVLLDFHVLSADFFRSAVENPFSSTSLFCTMLASARHVKKPWRRYMRLGELYQELFNKPLGHAHQALADAEATACCFFALMKRGEIDAELILAQQRKFAHDSKLKEPIGMKCYLLLAILLILFLFLLVFLIV